MSRSCFLPSIAILTLCVFMMVYNIRKHMFIDNAEMKNSIIEKIDFVDKYRQRWEIKPIITAPRKACQPDLKSARYYSQSREDKALYGKFFSTPPLCNGVYLEMGALDGHTYSNTKFYEDHLNWTGILIEAQPQNAAALKRNRASSHNVIVPEAVCPEGQEYVNFTGGKAVGGMPDLMPNGHKKQFFANKVNKVIRVHCRPLGAILRAAQVSHIDFFVLDVEGAELFVLETMDWTIPVHLFIVEMGRENDEQLIQLLAEKGYKRSDWNIRDHCPWYGDCTNNMVFENTYFKQ